MKTVIGLIAIAFFGYWFYSVTSIGEPKGFYCESVMGDKIVILPIRERIAFLEPDGMIYFYTDIESVKQPINEIHYQPN